MFDKYKNVLIYLSLIILFIVIIYVFYTQYIEKKLFNTYAENKEFVYKDEKIEEEPPKPPPEPKPPIHKEHNLYFYYANWCPYSNEVLSIWEKFIQDNKSKNINYYTVLDTDVDNTNTNDKSLKKVLFDTYVDGYPTLLFSKNKGRKDTDIFILESKITPANIDKFLEKIVISDDTDINI
jgi:hypothetical protein